MKSLLTFSFCLFAFLLTFANPVEASYNSEAPTWIEKAKESEEVKFTGIFTGEDVYEKVASELKRLTQKAEESHYPVIVIPLEALPEELWLELEAQVKVRNGLRMDMVIFAEGEDLIEGFAFSLIE